MNDQMPPPPIDLLMPSMANNVIAVINYAVLTLVFLILLREARRSRSLLPLFCLLGGAAASLQEPIYDIVGSVWYPQYGQTPMFRAFNVSVPLWMLPAYAWYISGQGYWMYRKFQAGLRVDQLWKFYALFWLSNLVLEVPGLTLGIYQYFGPQPFKVFGFPLWMAMTNSLMPIVIGATYWSLRDILVGGRVWLAAPIVPTVVGFAQIAAGWPTWLALNSGKGPLVTHAAAGVSLLLSLMVVYLVGCKFCSQASAVPAAVPRRLQGAV